MLSTKLLCNGVFNKSRKFVTTRFLLRMDGYRGKDQINYLKRIIHETKPNPEDWTKIKSETLSIPGPLNGKNVDSVFLTHMTRQKNYDAALSFAEHLKKDTNLGIGCINGLLLLYYKLGPENITEKDKAFILESYTNLYAKYKILDSTTCDRLLHALCAIKEWKKAVKVMKDMSNTQQKPTHSAYSNLIAMFFTLNNKNDAMKYIESCMNDDKSLTFIAYKEWIDYIIRNYTDKKTILKYLEEMYVFISRNCLVVTDETAEKIKETYASLGWNAQFTMILKNNGKCTCCKESLDCLKLTDEEFQMLQQNVKKKLIVGSDILLKTSHEELNRFLNFIQDNAPFDIVLDALNIALARQDSTTYEKVNKLQSCVNSFLIARRKVLLVGRKHMMRWPGMNSIVSSVDHFFVENISEDDPYFITAAILSGPHTDIVSMDLLRGHKFNLQSKKLRFIFQRWQWQHQWTVNQRDGHVLAPLPITPVAQKNNSSWHLPFDREDRNTIGLIKDGTPDWNSWLCLRPSITSIE